MACRLQVAKQLARLGVDVIEAGFPVASPDDFQAVKVFHTSHSFHLSSSSLTYIIVSANR